MPKPPLILFAPDETPNFIDFSFISEPDQVALDGSRQESEFKN
jgi:hypothetical protein